MALRDTMRLSEKGVLWGGIPCSSILGQHIEGFRIGCQSICGLEGHNQCRCGFLVVMRMSLGTGYPKSSMVDTVAVEVVVGILDYVQGLFDVRL